jgi:hypothetical protein
LGEGKRKYLILVSIKAGEVEDLLSILAEEKSLGGFSLRVEHI